MAKRIFIPFLIFVVLLFGVGILVPGQMASAGGNGGKALAAVALAEFESGEADGTHHAGGEKYWSYMGFGERVSWCACFVSWCANQCGFIDDGTIAKTALAEGFADYVRDNPDKGSLSKNDGSYTPRIGDIFVESPDDWNVNNDNNAQHTGIVVDVDAGAGTFTTVEGNSSDMCRKRVYQIGHDIDYFVTPNYPTNGIADLSSPLTNGQSVTIPSTHEHKAPDGQGGLECGESRGSTSVLGRPFTYTNYVQFENRWVYTQAEVCKKWQAAGRTSEDGIATINGYYLVAMNARFGAVGDYVRITLDNGNVINGIIADTKSDSDTYPRYDNESCIYGHFYVNSKMVSMVEFETVQNISSGDLSTTKPEWRGANVATVTNLGSIF